MFLHPKVGNLNADGVWEIARPTEVQVVLTFAQTENDLTVVNAGFYINIAALS